MDKPNVFKSSNFFLWAGDKLNIVEKDETGTAMNIGLYSEGDPVNPEDGVPLPPVTTFATSVYDDSFDANWEASALATKYYLDVATDIAFSSLVAGYSNKDVGDVLTYTITGLSASTPYFYRVRAYNTIGTSGDSNTEALTTLDPPIFAGTYASGLILKSFDNGVTFVDMGSEGVGNPTCFCQLSNGDVLYGTDTGYVVNYTKGTSVSLGPIPYEISSMASNGTTVIVSAGINHSVVYESTNNGATFGGAQGIDGGPISTVLYSDGKLLVFTNTRIWVSTTGNIVDLALKQVGDFTCACDIGSGTIYTGTSNGHIWKSVNYGATWTDLGDKTNGAPVSYIILGNSGRFIWGDSTVFNWYSDDDFASKTNVPIGNNCVSALYISADTVILGGLNGFIYRSTDNGGSWAGIAGNPQQGEISINALINTI